MILRIRTFRPVFILIDICLLKLNGAFILKKRWSIRFESFLRASVDSGAREWYTVEEFCVWAHN